MNCRVIRTKTDPTRIEETLKSFKEMVLPTIKKQPGFTGITGITNRKTGDTVTVTYWENDKAMKDAQPNVMPVAQKYLESVGGQRIEQDDCEVVVLARFQPSITGAFVRLTTGQVEPSALDKLIATYKEKALPAIKQQKGVRTAFYFVNRQAGRTFAGGTWDTEQDLEKSDGALSAIRREAFSQAGAPSPRVETFEILLTEVPAGTAASR